jgi:hypothetical protein
MLEPGEGALRARILARLAIALASDQAAASAVASQAVDSTQAAVAQTAQAGPRASDRRAAKGRGDEADADLRQARRTGHSHPPVPR